MSIEISSDDSNLSGDLLPEVALSVSSSKSTNSFGSTSTVMLQSEDKENLVDLTQSCDKDEVLVLSGSSSRSLREIRVDCNVSSRASSVHSDSTIELNTTELNTDDIYDQMCQSTLSQKSLPSQNSITSQNTLKTDTTANLANMYDDKSPIGEQMQENVNERLTLQKSLSCNSYLTPMNTIVQSPIRINTDDMFDQLYKSSSQRRSIKTKRNSVEEISFIEIQTRSAINFNNIPNHLPKESNEDYSRNVRVSTEFQSDLGTDNDDILPTVKISSASAVPKSVVTLDGESSASLASSSSGYVSDESRKRKAAGKGRGKKTTKTAEDAMSKKQKLAEEKRAKQLANEMNKVYKPGECMKYMTIEADAAWLERWELTEMKREAAAAAVTVRPITASPGVIRFSRGLVRQFQGDTGMMQLSKPKEHIDQALFVQTAEEIAPYVLSHTLANHVAQVKEDTGCSVTLVVFGVKDYYKSSVRKKSKNGGVEAKFNDLDLEMALTDVLVSCACAAWTVDSANELALLVLHYTKAIAEAPHKLSKRANDEQAEFYMRGDNKKCVAFDKDGHGLSRLWQQMVAILPKSSLETSRAVCAQYSSPLALYESLQEPNAINNLADVGVDRAGLPGARARRLGPEFANKLATLFTADDGDMLLD